MVFTRVSFGFEVCGVVTAELLIPDTAALVQVNVAPVVVLLGEYVNGELLHTGAVTKVLLSVGVGFTLTVTFWELLHPFAVRV